MTIQSVSLVAYHIKYFLFELLLIIRIFDEIQRIFTPSMKIGILKIKKLRN